MKKNVYIISAISLLLVFSSCATKYEQKKEYTEDIMSVPDVITEQIDPFKRTLEWKDNLPDGILYATVRKLSPPESKVPYTNERDSVLHLGLATVGIKDSEVSTDELMDISKLKTSEDKYPLEVTSVKELGILDTSLHDLAITDYSEEDAAAATDAYAKIINNYLAKNPVKDIYIFVHGVNTSFEKPILVSTEFWHYMGYRGVFIGFSWPSGQDILNYVTDVDNAEYSSVMFREFLQFLENRTNAEKIHILAWSAGTKLVSQALHQYSLERKSCGEGLGESKLGHVIFTAGDVERQLLSMYIADGMMDDLGDLTAYMSSTDKALKLSDNVVHKFPRLGQPWTMEEQTPQIVNFLKKNDNLILIDATGTPDSTQNDGHEYFRTSPWVSSDIISILLFGFSPEERGLYHKDDLMYWSFPDDYIEKLTKCILDWKKENGH
jgi:esterase/lipase superfamily enzyme